MVATFWESFVTSFGSVSVSVFIVGLCIYLYNRRGSSSSDEPTEASRENRSDSARYDDNITGDKSFTACSSPDCVRCKKYNQSASTALERLYKYSKTNSTTEISAIMDAVGSMQVTETQYRNQLQQPNVFYLPTLTAKPFWKTIPGPQSDDISILEENFSVIYREFCAAYDRITGHDSGGWRSNSSEGGSWHIYPFYNQGRRIEENCVQCPQTTAIIDSLHTVMSGCLFGNVLFSVLYPGTLVTEHYGPTNVRLRVHLGLVVPEGCTLTVGGRKKRWKEGRCVTFDDSFLHQAEVKDTGDDTVYRAVLLVDIWHPDLSNRELDALQYLFS